MNASPRDIVDTYFRCMQTGAEAGDELIALFADDAVYVEPFSGQPRTHAGAEAIGRTLRSSFDQSPPDLTLTVDRVDVDGDVVTTTWTCTSPAFPAPMRGRDVCTVQSGRIARLEVSFIP